MPDRIIRAGILTSDTMNAVSWPGEVFYRRLMSVADDFGRFDGRNSILRANLYPLKLDRVSDSDVGKWKGECSEAGLVRCYLVLEKEFVEIARFNQRMRAATSKWPPPPSDADIRTRPLSNASEAETDSETDSETTTKPPQRGREASASIEEAKAWSVGQTVIIPDDCVMAWHDDRTRAGWTYIKNGVECEIRDWRADLRTYARAWRGFASKSKSGPASTAKPESAWSLQKRIDAALESKHAIMGCNTYKLLSEGKREKVDALNDSIRKLKEQLAACPS